MATANFETPVVIHKKVGPSQNNARRRLRQEASAGRQSAQRMNVQTKYLRMIQGMKRRGRKDWTVYILGCGDGSLYTGIAKDVQARVKQHSEGRGATYTRTRLPVKLLYQQQGLTRSEALVREAQIKAMPRSRKEEIIAK